MRILGYHRYLGCQLTTAERFQVSPRQQNFPPQGLKHPAEIINQSGFPRTIGAQKSAKKTGPEAERDIREHRLTTITARQIADPQ